MPARTRAARGQAPEPRSRATHRDGAKPSQSRPKSAAPPAKVVEDEKAGQTSSNKVSKQPRQRASRVSKQPAKKATARALAKDIRSPSPRRHNTRARKRMDRSPEQEDDPSKSLEAPKHRDGMRSASESHLRSGYEQRSENIDSVVYSGMKFPVEYPCDGYPKELIRTREIGDSCLFVCCQCFKYTMDPAEIRMHEMAHMQTEEPVGSLVHSFGDGRYEIYEVDGANPDHQAFIQRMCLFGKFFIQNKSIWYEFDNFFFYILIDRKPDDGSTPRSKSGESQDENGFSYCGFYSKEKVCYDDNNLACIILYPPFRSMGLGGALIDFSYHVTKEMGKTGGPEKPISDLGKRGYLSYWTKTVANAILLMSNSEKKVSANSRSTRSTSTRSQPKPKTSSDEASIEVTNFEGKRNVTVDAISKATGMTVDDVLETLIYMDIINFESGKPKVSLRQLKGWSRGNVKRE